MGALLVSEHNVITRQEIKVTKLKFVISSQINPHGR